MFADLSGTAAEIGLTSGLIDINSQVKDAELLRLLIQIDQDRDGEDVNKIYYEKIISEYEDHMDYLRERLFLCEKIVESADKKEKE